MKYIIDISTGESPIDMIIHHPSYACRVLKRAIHVQTLEEYQKVHPKRPTGNKVQEIYIVLEE